MGGVHGDEINGIQIVRRVLEQQILAKLISGSVIAIPLLNVFGFINYSRDVPDGKDVNRSFPGSSVGSLASRTASALTKKVLPNVDNTGGASRYNYPQIRHSKKDTKAKELAQAFAAPYLIERPWITKSFRKTANQMDISVLVYEAGESERLDGFAIELGVAGIKRTLKALNMITDAPPQTREIISLRSTSWVRAAEAGLFTWTKQSGSFISKRVISPKSGHIIGHNNASVVHNGDALFNIAYQ